LAALFLTVNGQVEKIEHIVLIGVDGLGAYSFQDGEMPNLKALMKRGAWSLEARSVLPSSSAANWASMFMGASPELHGYTTWGSKKPELPSRVLDKYGMFPSIYGLLREKKPDAEIGLIYEWDGIGYLFPKQAVNLNKKTQNDSITCAEAVKYIVDKKPDLLFAYFHNADVTGHRDGHDTPAYYAAVKGVDEQIGQILQAIKDAGMEENTIVIASADHGGMNKGHGGITMLEMQIPWIIAGPGIKSDFRIRESIMTYDTAATIARILDLNAPEVWIGKPVEEAFRKK